MTIRGFVLSIVALLPAHLWAQAGADSSLLARPAHLSASNVPLAEALTELERRSGVALAYSRSEILDTTRVSCACLRVTVGQALDSLLRDTELTYRESGRRVLLIPSGTRSHRRRIEGTVLSFEERVPVPDVVLSLLGEGASETTDSSGGFVLEDVPAGGGTLQVHVPGLLPDTVVVPEHASEWTLLVRTRAFTMRPVIVAADIAPDRTRFEEDVQPSTVSIGTREIRSIPAAVEADVFRAVQLLPGTVARNDFSVGYNVRGGENDQNHVILDGIPVLNPTHLGGLFGSFDANTIEHVEFLCGGFPASYGGRLSSVLDLDVKTGRSNGFGASGQVSLLSSKLAFDGHLGPARFVFAGRRTYADLVVETFTRHELPYNFTDLTGKVVLPLGRNGTLSLTAFRSLDLYDYTLVERDTIRGVTDPIDLYLDWGNRLIGATWQQVIGRSTLTTRMSTTSFSTKLALLPNLAMLENRVNNRRMSTDLAFPSVSGVSLSVGGSAERVVASYGVKEPVLEAHDQKAIKEQLLPAFNREYRPITLSAYADGRLRIGGRLHLRPGMRVEHVSEANQTVVAPRLSFKLFLNPETALIGSIGRYYQALHSLRDQDLPFVPFEFWVGANRSIPVGSSTHMVLGVERWYGRTTQVLIEGYRKTFDNLVIPNRAMAVRDEGNEFLLMNGDSWGLDILVRRHWGAVRGWIGYSLNKATRCVESVTFPASHDRRHTLNVVLETRGPLATVMGARWTYGSPLPYTKIVGEWIHATYTASDGIFHRGPQDEAVSIGINDARFPHYSRLDLSFRWHFDKWGAEWSPYFQIANAYNKRNVFMYWYDYQAEPATRTGVSQLPIFPTFGVEFSW